MTATTSTGAESPAAVGGGPAPTDRPSAPPRRWPHVLGVGLITSLYAALYSTYLLVLHATLKDGLADVGEYDQAVSGYAHFMAPHSPFVGLPDLGSAGVLQLSDHFTPLLALLAPFYWIHDGPETLLVETAVLGALPIIPLWLFTRRAVGESRLFGTVAGYLVAIGYGVTWPLQMALWFEFHEVFLALPVMMWMIERAQAGRLRQAALVSLLLLGVKDDLGFVVAVFGVYLATKDVTLRRWGRFLRRAARDRGEVLRALRRSDRLWFLSLVPVGLLMVILVNKALLPAFGGSSTRNFTYTEFGATPGAAIRAMLGDPGTAIGTLFNSPFKTQTLSMLLWPVLGLCLLSPLSLMVAPLLIERFLSVNNLGAGHPGELLRGVRGHLRVEHRVPLPHAPHDRGPVLGHLESGRGRREDRRLARAGRRAGRRGHPDRPAPAQPRPGDHVVLPGRPRLPGHAVGAGRRAAPLVPVHERRGPAGRRGVAQDQGLRGRLRTRRLDPAAPGVTGDRAAAGLRAVVDPGQGFEGPVRHGRFPTAGWARRWRSRSARGRRAARRAAGRSG